MQTTSHSNSKRKLWLKKQELKKIIEYIDTHITDSTDQLRRDTAEEINKMLDDIIEDLQC